MNKYIKCNFGGKRCGTSTIVDVRRLKVNPYQLHKMELNKQLQAPALLTTGERDYGKHWQDSRAGHRTGLDAFEKAKMSLPVPGIRTQLQYSVFQPLA